MEQADEVLAILNPARLTGRSVIRGQTREPRSLPDRARELVLRDESLRIADPRLRFSHILRASLFTIENERREIVRRNRQRLGFPLQFHLMQKKSAAHRRES